ncbi:hypothetical protein [Falsirhodobacter sp. 1013]|uniref:hypothetical protein n=1 Tax=Falsirhodobacter sp. 1013 TaxID=3417566 RepID=UPI003EC0F164
MKAEDLSAHRCCRKGFAGAQPFADQTVHGDNHRQRRLFGRGIIGQNTFARSLPGKPKQNAKNSRFAACNHASFAAPSKLLVMMLTVL